MIRLIDGMAGSVQHTAFSLDAMIHPVLIQNQRRDLACPLVFSSTALAWNSITETSIYLSCNLKQISKGFL